MMSIYETDIQQLYVTYFARPADPDGLKFWESVVEADQGSTAAVAAAFSQSAEYRGITATMNPYQAVDALYNNLFGHDADIAGLNFWGTKLQNGSFTIDQAARVIVAGAQGSDLQLFQLKVAAAIDFTSSLATADQVLSYEGPYGAIVGKVYLESVTPDNPYPRLDGTVVTTGPVPSGIDGHGPTALAMPHPDAGAATVELIGIPLP